MAKQVAATIVEDIDQALTIPGALEIRSLYGEVKGMAFICPCGCGGSGWLPIRKSGTQHPTWVWDGNKEKPTLSPSVLQIGGCRWHGWLQSGVWVEC